MAEELAASLERAREIAEENGANAQTLQTITENLLEGSGGARTSRRHAVASQKAGSNGREILRGLSHKNGR
jgi:hypothetical protein